MPTREIYPWDLWFDGNKHILQRGIDYTSKTKSFKSYIYQQISERGLNDKFSVQINDEGNSITIELKRNEIAVRNNYNVIEGEIVDKNERVVSSQNNQIDKIIRQHSVQLIESVSHVLTQLSGQGGEKEVEKLKYDEHGQLIPIYKEFTGGYKIQIGFEKTTEIVKYGPTEKVELRRPQDFTCSVKKMAGIVAEIAKIGGIDISRWYFDDSKKNTLTIYSGSLAESRFSAEINPVDVLASFKPKPLTADIVDEWMRILEKDKLIVLWAGKDFPIGQEKRVLNYLNSAYPYYEFYGAPGRDSQTEWVTLKITMRKPMITRMNEGIDQWEKFKAGEEGKVIEQTYLGDLKIEQEEKLYIDSNFAKRQYIEQMNKYNEELQKIEEYASDNIKDSLRMEVENQIKILREEFEDKLELSHDELLKLELNIELSGE